MNNLALNDGSAIPTLGFGTYTLKGKRAVLVIAQAIALGYRLLDTAGQYENEATIGQAIKESGLEPALARPLRLQRAADFKQIW